MLSVRVGEIACCDQSVESRGVQESEVSDVEPDVCYLDTVEAGEMTFEQGNGCHIKLAAQGDAGDPVSRVDPDIERWCEPHGGSSQGERSTRVRRSGTMTESSGLNLRESR